MSAWWLVLLLGVGAVLGAGRGNAFDYGEHPDWDGNTYHEGKLYEPARASINEYNSAVAKADKMFQPDSTVDASSSSYDSEDNGGYPHVSQEEFQKTARDMSVEFVKTKKQQQQATAFEKQLRKAETHSTKSLGESVEHSKHKPVAVKKQHKAPKLVKQAAPKPQKAKVQPTKAAPTPQKKPQAYKVPKPEPHTSFDRIMELGEDDPAVSTASGWDPIKLLQVSEDQHSTATLMSSSELEARLAKLEAAARKTKPQKTPKKKRVSTAELKRQLVHAKRTNAEFEAKLANLEKLAKQP